MSHTVGQHYCLWYNRYDKKKHSKQELYIEGFVFNEIVSYITESNSEVVVRSL